MSYPPPLAIPGRFGVPNEYGQKFNKACDPCHISKTRCIPDSLSPNNACKRCSKNGNSCVFSPIGPRRRPVRSRNDRIVELERRVRDMQLKLEKQVGKGADVGSPEDWNASATSTSTSASAGRPGVHPKHVPELNSLSGSQMRLPEAGPSLAAPRHPSKQAEPGPISLARETSRFTEKSPSDHVHVSQPVTTYQQVGSASGGQGPDYGPNPYGPDVVDRNLVTLEDADKLLARFRRFIHAKFLGVGIPDGYTHRSLRRKKPAVWLSLLYAASIGSSDFVSLAPVLSGEMDQLLDKRLRVGMEPDLDVMQALLNFYLFNNDLSQSVREKLFRHQKSVASMLVRLGQASKTHNTPDGVPIVEDDVTEVDLELSRQILLWHWVSFTLALKARQNVLLRPFVLINTSLRVLNTSACQRDMALVEWTRLVQISVEACLALFSGHVENPEGLSDEARDTIIRTFERKQKQWLVDCPFDLVNELLMLEYHNGPLNLSEVMYPAGRADFKRRSRGLPSLSSPVPSPAASADSTNDKMPDQDVLAPYRINYTRKFIKSAHDCLALFLTPPNSAGSSRAASLADPELLRYFGNVPYTRVFYALRFLLFVAYDVWRTKKYDLIDIGSLRLDDYIQGLKRVLRVASDRGKFRAPSLWLNATEIRIEPWWRAFCMRLDSDLLLGLSLKSSGQVEGASALSTPTADQPSRQTTQPPPWAHPQTESPLFQDRPADLGLPDHVFPQNQSSGLLAPWDFTHQAHLMSAVNVVSEMPSIGRHPIAGTVESLGGVGSTGGLSQSSSASSTLHQASNGYAGQSSRCDIDVAYHEWQGSAITSLDNYLGTMEFNFDWGDYGTPFLGAETLLLPPCPDIGDESGDGLQED